MVAERSGCIPTLRLPSARLVSRKMATAEPASPAPPGLRPSSSPQRRTRAAPPKTAPGPTASRRRVRESSRSPRRDGDDGDDAEKAVPNSEPSSIEDEWTRDQPRHGCNTEALRWFVIKELGELRQHAKQSEQAINKHHIRLDIMEQKIQQKPTKEKTMKANDDLAKQMTTQMNDYAKGIEDRLKTMSDVVEETRKIAKYDELLDKLKTFEGNIHKAFQHVDHVERELIDHTSREFSNFSVANAALHSEVQTLKVSVNTFNSNIFQNSKCSGGTSPQTAGAHDGQTTWHTPGTSASSSASASTTTGPATGHLLAPGEQHPSSCGPACAHAPDMPPMRYSMSAAPRQVRFMDGRFMDGSRRGGHSADCSCPPPFIDFSGTSGAPQSSETGPSAAAATTCTPCGPNPFRIGGGCGGPSDQAPAPGAPAPGGQVPGDGQAPVTGKILHLGGSHSCHCIHLDQLAARVAVVEQTLRRADTSDPWHRFDGGRGGNNRGPGGGGGGDRGGDPDNGHGDGPGGGSPGGDPRGGGVPEAPPDFPVTPLQNLEKLFDDKIAISEDFKLSGFSSGDKWRTKVHGYWVSRCPPLMPMLNWAEKHDAQSVKVEDMYGKLWRRQLLPDGQIDRINELVWGFLNTCISGEARTCFESVNSLSGLDAWRAIVQEIQRGRNIRLAQLRKIVRNPPGINKVDEVANGIMRFENNIRDYVAAGGDQPNPKEMKSDLLDTLPQELRENLMWRLPEDEGFSAFKNHVRTAANNVPYHRGKISAPVNLIDGNLQEELKVSSEKLEDLIGALFNKMGFKQNGGGSGGAGQRRGQPLRDGPSGPRPARCGNCGDKDHTSQQCTKQRIPPEKRPCWECGKPGHTAANCRSKNTVGAIDTESDSDEFLGHVGCSHEADGWATVPSKPAQRPMPRQPTLSDFMPTYIQNTFNAFADEEENVDSLDSLRLVRNVDEWPTLGNSNDANEPNDVTKRQRKRRAAKQNKEGNKNTMVSERDFAAVLEEFTNDDEHVSPPWAGRQRLPEACSEECPCYPLEYGSDDEELLNVDDEVEITVASDSGCICHVCGPKDVPKSVKVVQPPNGKAKNFVGAGGDRIKNYGKVQVALVQDDGKEVSGSFQVADVTRPLHSTGQICDENKEMLYTKHEAVVVPAGSLSKFLGMVKHIAKYKRSDGGLYLAKMRARARPSNSKPANRPPEAPFGRQGSKR